MPLSEDMELLQEYVVRNSDSAFEAILKRHIHLVYSTALRQVRDPSLASDVTQTTFIILARKARTLTTATILSGWLYRTTMFAASRAMRTEARRRERDNEALKMQTEQTETCWEELAPVLDEAMGRLSSTDRAAVVLRYFENKTTREVGDALGVNEAAAQKRVNRAVEKLRKLAAKRGVVASAVVLTAAISANAIQAAPVAMVATTAAALKGGAALTASTAALVNGTLKLIAWYKLKTAAMVGLGSVLVAGTVVLVENAGPSPDDVRRELGQTLEQLDDGKRQTNFDLQWVSWQNEAKQSPQQAAAAQAVRKLGTNALPYLITALDKKQTGVDGLFGWNGLAPAAFHRRAVLAFDALGAQAEPAIPELTRLMHGTNCPQEAAIALAAVGPKGWEVLTRSINDPVELTRASAIWAIGSRRAAAPGTIKALEDFFERHQSTGEDPISGWAMVQLGQDREKVISLLTRGLDFQRVDSIWGSAVALGEIGPAASNALPKLIELLQNPNPVVRHDAAQAIELIDPQAAAQAGAAGKLTTRHIPVTYPD
jgi:RNA polymerase sigma factor (sigma-70 family)